jgi:hypothetical protein
MKKESLHNVQRMTAIHFKVTGNEMQAAETF